MNDETFSLTTSIIATCLLMILSGSAANLAFQVQSTHNFKHSMFTCQQMFLGETLSLFCLALPLLLSRFKTFKYFIDFGNELSPSKLAKEVGLLRAGFGGLLDVFAS